MLPRRSGRCPTCGSSVRVITGDDGTSFFQPLDEPVCPDAYVAPIGGGWDGYQARCWGCDWEGPLRPSGRDGKRATVST